MREFPSKSFILLIFLFSSFARADFKHGHSAIIDKFIDFQKVTAISDTDDWEVGEVIPVISQNSKLGVIAFLELNSVKSLGPKKFEIRAKLLRQSRKYFIQTGDVIRRMELAKENDDFVATTDLLIRQSRIKISARYRPLVYQGFSIGETAQTLYENELLVTYLGNLFYGYKDWLTINTFATADVVGRPNFAFKARLIDTEANTLATGLSYVHLNESSESTVNLNLYWDSTSTDALISHIFISLGLLKWQGAADAAAIKALGSSSFQSGYEIIMDNWNRLLVGPNYNFEKKALGGYISYIWVWDQFHAQASLNSTDITHLRLDPSDGYYGFIDLFWRF